MVEDNLKIFKNDIGGNLGEVKKCKIHILMLLEKNDDLCQQNNIEIERLNKVIENRLANAKKTLNQFKKITGERKIETSGGGWVHLRVMPDKWTYIIKEVKRWIAKFNPADKAKFYEAYIKVEESLKKEAIKKDILEGNVIPGVTHEPQSDKFEYKLPGGGLL